MMIQVLVLPFSSSSLSLCFVIKVVVVVGRLDYYMIDYLKNEIWCEDSGLPLIQNGRKYGPIKSIYLWTQWHWFSGCNTRWPDFQISPVSDSPTRSVHVVLLLG